MFKFLKRNKDKKSEGQPKTEPQTENPSLEQAEEPIDLASDLSKEAELISSSAQDDITEIVEPQTDIIQQDSPAQASENSDLQDIQLPTEPKPENEKPKKVSLFKRLTSSLTKTRQNFTGGLANLFLGKKEIDDELLDEIETQLITADVGIEAAEELIKSITDGVSRKEIKDPQAVLAKLKDGLLDIIQPCEQPLNIDNSAGPYVIMMIGVNGSGKTTTIGKLANKLKAEGKSVMLAAGDTFRAAAIEQLQVWGHRNDVPVIAQHTGADSASVAFDALSSAKAKGIDVLIIDTAGRLHTADNLMEELKKVKRVLAKQLDSAPHEVMLVLDAGIGQNALLQAEKFNEAIGLNAITLTKLDGTAKGGILFAIAKKLKLPIRFIGCGERIEDLRSFNALEFIEALFAQEETREDA